MNDLEALAEDVAGRERSAPGLKPDNEARIVFHPQKPRSRLPLAVVYLHGFTASQAEGDPAHRAIAEACGAHLFLNRLSDHGSDLPSAMAGASAERWRADADEALRIGLELGEQVLLVGTSMGASLALDLAARHASQIAGVVAWSPGIRVYDPVQLNAAVLLRGAVDVPGERTPFQRRYWSSVIHSDGYRAVAELFLGTMQPGHLRDVVCPVLFGVWDGGADDHDTLTSVAAMREAFDWLGSPEPGRRLIAYDHAAHVLASPQRSPAAARVLADAVAFVGELGFAG